MLLTDLHGIEYALRLRGTIFEALAPRSPLKLAVTVPQPLGKVSKQGFSVLFIATFTKPESAFLNFTDVKCRAVINRHAQS